MNLLAVVLLANSLTFPFPPEPARMPDLGIQDTPDLYNDEPDITALSPAAIRYRLHQLGFSPIRELYFIKGRWHVRADWQGKRRRLVVDQNSGMVLADKPDR